MWKTAEPPAPPALGSQGVTGWFWSITRRKGGLKVDAFVLPLTVGERKSSPGSLECGFGEFRLFREV